MSTRSIGALIVAEKLDSTKVLSSISPSNGECGDKDSTYMEKFDVHREFVSIGNRIVIWVDDEKCSDLFVKFQSFHVQCP